MGGIEVYPPERSAMREHDSHSLPRELKDLLDEAMRAFEADEAMQVRDLLGRHPPLKALVNQPIGPFDSPPVIRGQRTDPRSD